MNLDLTIEDVIAQIGEEGAYRFFVYTIEEFPLDPRGWDGMAHLAYFYRQFDRAEAYTQRSYLLSSGSSVTPPPYGQANAHDYPGPTHGGSSRTSVSSDGKALATLAKIVLVFGLCCCMWQAVCNRSISQSASLPSPTPIITSSSSVPNTASSTPAATPSVETNPPRSETDLKNKSLFELDCLRNEPFARHGYRFKRRDLREYFEKQSWYKATTDNQDKIWEGLSHDERAYINAVKDEQARRK